MWTVFTSLACYPGAPLAATENTAGCWAGVGEDCRLRTTWRPLTLAGSPVPPCASLEVLATPARRVPRQDVNSPFIPCVCRPSDQRCAHTRRFGTLAGPPPPVDDMPWRPISLAIILITASSSSKMYNLRPTLRRVCVCGNHGPHATTARHHGFPFVWVCVCVSRTEVVRPFSIQHPTT